MTKKYSAADFANARFAELGKYGLRAHKSASDSFWQRDGIKRASNEEMANAGWVPVTPARTVHDSDVEALCDPDLYEDDRYLDGFIAGFEAAGGTILDDPEPTNKDKLANILVESFNSMEFDLEDSFREIAAVLDKHGVAAPNVKGN